jgi:hypothetical protein
MNRLSYQKISKIEKNHDVFDVFFVSLSHVLYVLFLDKFIKDGRVIGRGIIQYLANGKHGQFAAEEKKTAFSLNNRAGRERVCSVHEE